MKFNRIICLILSLVMLFSMTAGINLSAYAETDDDYELNCEHIYDDGKVTKKATCKETGVKTFTCTVCGETQTEDIAKTTSHTYKTTTTKATTKKNGSKVTKCSVCGKQKSKSIIYYPKTITLSTTSYTYNGKAKKPGVTVKNSKGNKISSSNYTVTYPKGRKNVGKYTVTIKFKGNYSGTVKKNFTINPNAKVSLSKTTYTYDGKTQKPTITVKTLKGKKISSKNYTVSYSKGRKNVGKYTVTVKLKGSYNGTIKKTFTIKPKATTLSSVTAKANGFTAKWKKQAKQTTGYEIQYATDSEFTKNQKTVTVSKSSTTSKTVSSLTGNKKYYVRVRTYKTVKVSGKSTKIYSSWSKSKTVTTKKKIATAADTQQVADKVIKYINSYRSTNLKKLPGLTKYAEYRSKQLVKNFAHDTKDARKAATALKYGDYYSKEFLIEIGAKDTTPYYDVDASEAIGKVVGGTVDEIAKSIATGFKNSAGHWRYVGSSDNKYIGVGITYSGGYWYCCVFVAPDNVDTNSQRF
ncbi:MAG: fibronectin type III domain-containing protein [Eubacterium sp.]|nr:fibronectin type III domain-containing protein [Eubacterium sp.]